LTDEQNDLLLTQYLLGELPPGETERLDELSVTDDDFALRLSAAENDLLDAYVRGELPAKTSEQLKSAYLSSEKGLEKLRFAETLYSYQQRKKTTPATSRAALAQRQKPDKNWASFNVFHVVPQWGLALAAILLLAASGYLAKANRQLRHQVDQSETERAALSQREQQLRQQLEVQPSVNSANPGTNPSQSSQPLADQLQVAAFVLIPALRGSGPLPTVSVSADTDLVVLRLELEANEFRRYRVALEDSATRQTVWRSADLKAFADDGKQAVSFALRKDLLKQQNYILQLEGIRANGATELASSYSFRVLLK
jgi:hypothetical protein